MLASLIRLLGGFELAEEALHDAFAAAAAQWPRDGLPANPRAWLVSAGRFKAIDRLRRKARFGKQVQDELSRRLDEEAEEAAEMEEEEVADDQLRLIFVCCHPALPADARVALTLREVCGLTTEEIARAFLTATPALAQRIVRAKARIKDMQLPYEVPPRTELPDRLAAVLKVIYLVFNEGYSNHRMDIADEAIRLGRLAPGMTAATAGLASENWRPAAFMLILWRSAIALIAATLARIAGVAGAYSKFGPPTSAPEL